ncbi:MAG: hypothetical protein HOH33_17085 [Verrucomicrobia bacterium]|jgi:hypothetical protein|nr:hypothetical protein [Verrucomicrobiota bacterium]
MFFGSKVNVNELRKRMLVMECDTHRLELSEKWRDLRGEVGFGSEWKGSSRVSVRRWGHWVAPIGAFLLTSWLRVKPDSQVEKSISSNHWGLLGQFFDWMAKLSPHDKS